MKSKIIIIFLLLTAVLHPQNELQVSWAVSTGGSLYDYANDIAVDRSGNIYVLGSFEGLISFGSFDLQSSGGYDILLIKYNPDGEVLWAEGAGGQGYDAGLAITIDNSENVIITGVYDYYAQFNDLYAEGHLADIFLAKYSPEGNTIWVKGGGGEANDASFGITTDRLNNIIITGTLQGPANFDSVYTASSRYADIFIVKYNEQGNVLWLRTAGDTDYDVGYDVAANENNEIIVVGSFSGSMFFGNRFDMLTSNGGQDMFIVKFDADGKFVWSRSVGGANYDNASSLVIDNNGDLLITGTYSDTVSFGNRTLPSTGFSDLFAAKYNQDSGEPIWVIHEGKTNYNYDGIDITTDSDGNISLIGRTAGSQVINSTFIASYTTEGNKSGDYSIISPNSINITGISYNSRGDLLFTGTFFDELTLGNFSLKSNGSQDVLLAQLNTPTLQLSTTEIEYEQQFLGEPTSKTFTIKNTGAGTLIINDLQLMGPDSESFIFLSETTFNITANSSAEIPVQFTPARPGLNEAYLVILSNASTSPDSILLTGSGILKSPVLSVESLDFGQVIPGESATQEIEIFNPNNIEMNINAAIIPESVHDFTIQSFNRTLPSSGSVNISIEFTPLNEGLSSAELIIYGEEFPDSLRVNLNGGGVVPALELSGKSLDFGTIDVNSSISKILKMISSGSSHIIIAEINIIGKDRNDFTLLNASVPDTLNPSSEKILLIEFAPKVSGIKTAALIIRSNSGSSPDSIELTGTAVALITVKSEEINIGQNVVLNVTPPSGFQFNDNKLFYRRSGERVYNETSLVSGTSGYLANIPSSFSTIRGIEYYVVFSDGSNTVTFPVSDPQSKPAVLTTKISRITYPLALGSSVYQMVSVPLSLIHPQIDSVLIDDYGAYDKSVWRILRWDQTLNDYLEYPDLAKNLSPGNAFWIINRDAQVFDLENASSVPSDKPFLINLESGWNQVGSPFSFPVAWDSIENSNEVQSPIYWNPETNDYELDEPILEPWKGYWIYNPNEALSLSVSPVEAGSIGKIQSMLTTGRDEFILQIRIVDDHGTKDDENFVGMLKDAQQGWDKEDILEPPPIMNKVKLAMIRDNYELAADFISVNNEGACWDLVIKDSKDKKLTLNIEQNTPLPEDFKLWLLDLDKMIPIALKENSMHIILGDNMQGRFRLIAGTEKFAADNSENISLIPSEYVLYQNYPNPFNPSTTITYQLSEKGSVVLEIFNMLGEKIETVANGEMQFPGLHHFNWNASNLPSGIYIYKIKANSFTASKSMLLLK